MYTKYHTDALVLGNYESGEADRAIVLYTRDFGLVRARAGGVRLEKSKMRYALHSYAYSRVSLVRGKNGWRAAGATSTRALPTGGAATSFARIAALASRLIAGEERNDYLFAALSDAHASLAHSSLESIPTIEIMCVARVLYALGYISAEAQETTIFSHTTYADEHVAEAHHAQDALLASINKALNETHL